MAVATSWQPHKVATSWQPHFRKRTCVSEYTQTTSTSFSGPLEEGTDEHR